MINARHRDSSNAKTRVHALMHRVSLRDFQIDLICVVPRMQSFGSLAVKVRRVNFPSNNVLLLNVLYMSIDGNYIRAYLVSYRIHTPIPRKSC